jgi:homoserine acetyltransferase
VGGQFSDRSRPPPTSTEDDDSDDGHDGFLLAQDQVANYISTFLSQHD